MATPEGVVMTTGAMESFAKLGDLVNVATFELSSHMISPRFCYTDGAAVKCCCISNLIPMHHIFFADDKRLSTYEPFVYI